jgi:hypothetical protein
LDAKDRLTRFGALRARVLNAPSVEMLLFEKLIVLTCTETREVLDDDDQSKKERGRNKKGRGGKAKWSNLGDVVLDDVANLIYKRAVVKVCANVIQLHGRIFKVQDCRSERKREGWCG